MKQARLVVVAASLSTSMVSALAAQQSKTAQPSASADARAVLALEDAWAAAAVKRDAATFRRLLAPGFVYTEDARTQTGDELVHDIVAGSDTLTEARNEALKVHPFGTTIVVTGWLVMRGHGGGKPFERRYRFTDTWLKRNGQWQIIAAQDYLVPAGTR